MDFFAMHSSMHLLILKYYDFAYGTLRLLITELVRLERKDMKQGEIKLEKEKGQVKIGRTRD